MSEDVVITMQHIQDAGKEEEKLSFVTDGEYFFENNTGHLKYFESNVTGMPGTVTSLSIMPDRIVVDRKGTVTSRMEFREGEKHSFSYDTPFGTAEMGINTRAIRQNFDADGGKAEIEYILDYEHRQFTRNRFVISVKQQGDRKDA